MTIEIFMKFMILCFTGAGMFQISKWLQFKDSNNKIKYLWNSFIIVICLGIYILSTWFLFEDNF